MAETFRSTPAGSEPRPTKAGDQSEASFAWLYINGQPWLRSANSEHTGCVIEPRKREVVGADAVQRPEGNTEAPRPPGAEVPPGSKIDGTYATGCPGTWGDPVVSTEGSRYGNRVTKTLAWEGSGPPAQERKSGRNGGNAKRRQRSAAR